MNYWQQWAHYIQQLQHQLVAQAGKMAEMEKAIEALQTEMKSWKEQKRIHIDKIEYKFDQLKVEQLDGTLNIGLTPGALEDLSVNGTAMTDEDDAEEDVPQQELKVQPGGELQAEIRKELKHYVETQSPKQIERLQTQYGQHLDSWHQKMIVEDLLRQVEVRSRYYLEQMTPGATPDQLSSIKDSVLFRTRNDIKAAINNYFTKFNKNKGDDHEFSSNQ